VSALATRLADLPAFLKEHVERYRVPGASVAVLYEDEVFEAATGVVNVETGVEATPDAVFQIGSITKVFTSALVMQLVDAGRLDLDAPVRSVLPELELADSEAARTITPRHLLTHTSGIDGDHFVGVGRGADSVARFVTACAALPQLHTPGQGFSYCNAGFVLAGRIVEKLRAKEFGRALCDHLLDPIGARSMHTRPEYALYYRAAIGHLIDSDRGTRVVPLPLLPFSNAPAGSTPFAAARDLLAMARMILSGGRGESDVPVLAEETVAAMQQPQVTLHEGAMAQAWGLGFEIFDWQGTAVVGHGGSTIGQASELRLLPEHGVAIALLMNGGNTAALANRVLSKIGRELVGAAPPPPPTLPEEEVALDLERYEGVYERLAARHEVTKRDGKLWMGTEVRHMPIQVGVAEEVRLRATAKDRFVFSAPGSRMVERVAFLEEDDGGRPRFIHVGGRSAPRVL
jgi:CubicO group peptidase (beta-lactamase class C family)